MKAVLRFLKSDDGPAAVEYAVMLALIIIVALTAITTLGTSNNVFWGDINSKTAEVIAAAQGTSGGS